MFPRLCVCALLLAVSGCGLAAIAGKPAAPADPDKVAVEKWLRENLDSGTWEEIEWRPRPDMKTICEKQIQSWIEDLKRFQHLLDATPDTPETQPTRADLRIKLGDYEMLIDNARVWARSRMCGIKIRTTNQFGAPVVMEKIFDIYDDSIVPMPQVDRQYTGWRYLRGEFK